jgi:hypothetical protein
MTATVNRIYKNKDVDMLIALSTIVQSAIVNKTFLQTKRSTWADPFFDDLVVEIDQIVQDFLGVDSAINLREATQVVVSIQAGAIVDLAEVKVQIVEDFKDTPIVQNEILIQLGFTAYHKDAQKGDQEALINLLFQFKTNLTPTLKAKIEAKGTPAATLDAIVAYADILKNANISQEGSKGTRKVITAEAINAFNAIYSKVISISKISTKFYKDNPAVQEQFSYNKVTKTINAYKKAQPATTTP